jgi:hypothetical protein
MTSNEYRKKVTFAQAEGKIRFPSALKWGELDDRMRAALWNSLHWFFDAHVKSDEIEGGSYYIPPLGSMLLREYLHRRHGFQSDFISHYRSKAQCIADWAAIFKQWDYVDLFDFLTYFLRDRDCPKPVVETVHRALDHSWSPYRLLQKPPTIIPAVSNEEAITLTTDLNAAFASKFEASKVHLQSALDFLNKGEHRAVVRESINAVESAVRDFTGDQNAILSRALKKLTDDSGLHPALANAFEKLYAYTSDEKGIRHALVFADNEKVGFDEAIFFVSACSAFIGLLARKAY